MRGDAANVTDRLISEQVSRMIIEMEKPFAVLDAAIERSFPGYYPDIGCEGAIVHYDREELTSGSVRYMISARDPGDLGSITVYQTGSETCKVLIWRPKRPQGRLPADEDMAAIRGIHDKRQYKRELQRLLRAIRVENDEIYEERCRVHDKIVRGTLTRVQRDLGLSRPPSIAGKPETMRDEPQEREQEAWRSIPSNEIRKRRNDVKLYFEAGYSPGEIAKAGSWALRTVSRDLKWLRDQGLIY